MESTHFWTHDSSHQRLVGLFMQPCDCCHLVNRELLVLQNHISTLLFHDAEVDILDCGLNVYAIRIGWPVRINDWCCVGGFKLTDPLVKEVLSGLYRSEFLLLIKSTLCSI